jgi:hypothetical protein
VLISRFQREGLPFLTKTLPKFEKYVLACIESNKILKNDAHIVPTDFKWKSGYPLFMRVLLKRVIFDRCAESLKSIRQICSYFYKLSLDYSKELLTSAEQEYVERDRTSELNWDYLREGRKVFNKVFQKTGNVSIHDAYRNPRNGPGAFSGSGQISIPFEVYKLYPDSYIGTTTRRFSDVSGLFRAYPSARYNITYATDLNVAEVVFVPKDSRGPRVISKEPLHNLRAQLSALDILVDTICADSKGRINFLDQRINRTLAQKASVDRSLSTLDCRNGSDLLQNRVVNYITSDAPVNKVFQRSRTEFVRLPSGKITRLNKYANMGNGLCFPAMALTMYIAVLVGIMKETGMSLPKARQILLFVYGDDIIVDSRFHNAAISGLEAFGFCINRDKSFAKGFFRESCGGDYLAGSDVTPVRLKLQGAGLGEAKQYRRGYINLNDNGTLQLERHCRELVDKGLYCLSYYYYKRLKKALGDMPNVSRKSVALGIYDPHTRATGTDFRAFIPRSVKLRSVGVDPYKGIAMSLKKDYSSILDTPQPAYGEVALRHKVKLIRKRLGPTAFDPTPCGVNIVLS